MCLKNSRLSFSDAGSSGFKVNESIDLTRKDLATAVFFAFPVLFVCKILKINMLLIEAAGVGQTPQPQSKQLIDSEKFKSVMIVIIFRSRHNPVTNGR